MAFDTEDDDNLAGKVIGLIFIILILGTIFERNGWLDSFRSFSSSAENTTISEPSDLSPNRIFPSGEISLGDVVINKREVIVRDQPGGQPLGKQFVRETARVIEGPENVFEKQWWRVDYPSAPDGWINKSDITKNVFWFKVFNVIPITLGYIQPILIIISLIVIVLIIWISSKRHELTKIQRKKKMLEEEQKFSQESKDDLDGEENIDNLPTGDDAPRTEDVHNRRWANVQSLINSHSVNDWKQAIIEADIVLEEMLDKMGYKGETVGDKLKKVEKSDFLTLNKAWEAHKIRNRIAHKGSEYVLTKDDADRAIKAYTEVFKEFYFI
jgi:hypothetical protein